MQPAVLIVEDDDNVAALEIALAALSGTHVVVLNNGRDALALLGTRSFAVAAVVTDLHLPYVDGFELIAAIRGEERYSHLPIIVVSGDSHPETADRVRNLGADAFFAKPYSPIEICERLEHLLHA